VTLPSNVPRYGGVDLIDIDVLDPLIVRRPASARLRAWAKLQETERRWIMFEWLAHSVRVSNRCRLLFDDFASAFLLSLEATLQVLKAQHTSPPPFEAWLKSQLPYDLTLRGLRTHRNLEAHVRPGVLGYDYGRTTTSLFFGAADSGKTTAWLLPQISVAEFSELTNAKLGPGELSAWNQVVEEIPAAELMRRGIRGLQELLIIAESAVP